MDGAHEDQVTAVPNTVQSVGESSSTTESGLNKTNERTTEVPREEESTTSPTTASATSAPEPVGRNRTRINRIDVHHHFIPTCYANAYREGGGEDPSGWKLPAWTLDATKTLMTEQSIGTAILSLTAPGCTILHGEAAARLAREVNESAAAIRDSDPSRFGFFAALPPLLDDMNAAVNEAIYALEVLRADGITLYTRYGPGNTYLGDSALLPLWTALDARDAIVFIHPTHLPTTTLVNPSLPQPIIDYPHETARTALDLITQNRIQQFPRCKIILSHAGGTLPYLVTRAAHLLADTGLLNNNNNNSNNNNDNNTNNKTATEILADARSFYFDLALSGNEFTIGCLMGFAGPEKILFGTDFPYAPMKTVRTNVQGLEGFLEGRKRDYYGEEGRGVGVEDLVARGNAVGLFPRLRG